MREANFTVSCMHADMEQKDRDTIMKTFRGGERSEHLTTIFITKKSNSIVQPCVDQH
jgi:hypothetical protein